MGRKKQLKKLVKINAKAWDCPDRETAQKILKKVDKIRQRLSRNG